MINKQFDLNKFYAQSAKMSDFLKGKGHDISRTTLLHGLSVMMGEKNWNTLKPKLEKSSLEQNTEESKEILNDKYGINPSIKAINYGNIYFGGEAFESERLIECVESLFNNTNNYPKYNLDDIHDYEIFDKDSLFKDDFSLNDAFDRMNDPTFITKYLKLTDNKNDIKLIENDSLQSFNSFINSAIEKRKLIGDELFFRFSFNLDLNQFKRENVEKLLTVILFQHALSPRNTYSNDFFVLHPLVKVNCRGNRVKISIYSFINADYVKKDSNGHFRLPLFFEESPFIKEDYPNYDPNVRMKTLHAQEGFVPNVSASSLNDRQLCVKILSTN